MESQETISRHRNPKFMDNFLLKSKLKLHFPHPCHHHSKLLNPLIIPYPSTFFIDIWGLFLTILENEKKNKNLLLNKMI